MTRPTFAIPIFYGLSGLAFMLLWGLMAVNGTVVALLKASWFGVLPDGTLLKTSYSGIWPVDFFLRILAAFFYGLQNLEETPPYLMLADLVAALLVINMVTLVESRRLTASRWLNSSVLWQYLWNCAGVALFLPIYSLHHVMQRSEGSLELRLPAHEAQALPYTAIWSLILPIPLMAPGLVHATPFRIQEGLVMYFLTPAAFVLFQVLISTCISKNDSFRNGVNFVKTAYFIPGTASVLIHLAVVSYVLFSPDAPNLSLGSLYLPSHEIVHQGQGNSLTAAAFLFFQWDYIIINLTVIFHGIYLFQQASRENQNCTKNLNGLILRLVVMTAVLGPGAGLAFVLWCEEDRLWVAPRDRCEQPYGT